MAVHQCIFLSIWVFDGFGSLSTLLIVGVFANGPFNDINIYFFVVSGLLYDLLFHGIYWFGHIDYLLIFDGLCGVSKATSSLFILLFYNSWGIWKVVLLHHFSCWVNSFSFLNMCSTPVHVYLYIWYKWWTETQCCFNEGFSIHSDLMKNFIN